MTTNYYKILNVLPSATNEEIRNSYRDLARRYHPDLCSDVTSQEKFHKVQEAYEILSDPQKRRKFDEELARDDAKEFGEKFDAYQKSKMKAREWQDTGLGHQSRRYQRIIKMQEEAKAQQVTKKKENDWILKLTKTIISFFSTLRTKALQRRNSIKVFQIDITLEDAIYGVTKSFSLKSNNEKYVAGIDIPAGTRIGQTFKILQSHQHLVCVIKNIISPSENIRIEQEGLVIDLPITINEAIAGTKINIPTIFGNREVVIPPNTNSGTRIKLKKQGIKTATQVEDLIINVLIYVPESNLAIGLLDKSKDLDQYYENKIRKNLEEAVKKLQRNS